MKRWVTLLCLFLLLLTTVKAFGKAVVVTIGGTFYVIKLPDDCSDFQAVTSDTGKIWMDRNLGACQVAESISDAEAYGDLYQWGRSADGHEKRDSETTSTLSNTDTPGHGDFIIAPDYPSDWRQSKNDSLWQGVNGTNNPCPAGFRLPTSAEWQAELNEYGTSITSLFSSPLKLAAPGYRHYFNGIIYETGSTGRYWTSTVSGNYTDLLDAYSTASIYNNFRGFGASVRCIKD
jgi:uncharacterized protein (TIGR02145 family)